MEYPSFDTPPAGSIRFNTDSKMLEIYNGEKWWNIDDISGVIWDGSGTTAGRGICVGGNTGSYTNVIEYITINSNSNGTDFGDLSDQLGEVRVASSRTRGVMGGGFDGSTNKNVIEYITFSSLANATDFGDLLNPQRGSSGGSNQTRAVWAGGYINPANVNAIQYVTIAATGNAIDFGDYTNPDSSVLGGSGTACSPTRMVMGGNGYDGCSYLTFSTTGNTSFFGNETTTGGITKNISSSSTRGVFWHSDNTISYCTIATLGNFVDFGDASTIGFNSGSGCSSQTRSVAFSGWNNPGSGHENKNYIDYVNIPTTGNATDFGDLTAAKNGTGGGSDSHGGVQSS